MSRENVELVRRIVEAHDRRDWDAVFAAYDPDIEWHVARLAPAAGLGIDPFYVGHDGVRAFFRQWFSAWETVQFEYDDFIDAGDQVVVLLKQRVRGRSSGVELNWPDYAQVWTIRDGRVVRSEFFADRDEALRLAGLRPRGG